MKKLILMLGVIVIAILGVLPGVALADGGFSIGPAKLVVSVPEDGSSLTHVYVTSYVDGELIVGTENIPFRVVPENVPISANDRERKIEFQVYGNPAVEAGEYSGKLTFRIRSEGNVAYGIKIKAIVTQVGPQAATEITQGLPETEGRAGEASLMDMAKDNILVVVLGALVLILLSVIIGILIGRRRSPNI